MADIERIKKLRDTLKAGKNLPLRVCIDSGNTIIDESNPLQFTLWDDVNGVVYSFRLPDPISSKLPSNKERCVSVNVALYEFIQTMEVVLLDVNNIPAVIHSIRASGRDVKAEMENLIINTFDKVLKTDYVDLTHAGINKLVGSELPTSDSYYDGKFAESFKETITNKYYNKCKEEE